MYDLQKYEIGKVKYSDYYALDDGNRYELNNGELSMTPAPSFFHQRYSFKLANYLENYVEENDLGWIVVSPIDVIIDDYNVVQPDVAFIAKENNKIIDEKGLIGPPDLVVEFVSPSSYHRDIFEKKEIYEQFGIKEYWIVDINNKIVEVFTLKDGKYELFSVASGSGKVSSKIITGFQIEIVKIISESKK
jgi:Uma2 family endonuclease